MRADLFVTPVLAPFLGPNWLFSFYSVFGIELFKKFEKRKKEKKKIKIALSLGYLNSYFYNEKMKYVDLMAI